MHSDLFLIKQYAKIDLFLNRLTDWNAPKIMTMVIKQLEIVNFENECMNIVNILLFRVWLYRDKT
jgi:hypothetical protein